MTAHPLSLTLLAFLVVAATHAFFLRFAVKLMLQVPMRYGHALGVIAIEYLAAAAAAGALLTQPVSRTAIAAVGAVVLVFVGAALIGRTAAFADGQRVGVGNGVLVQFMQVPLILPFAILASFLLDALG